LADYDSNGDRENSERTEPPLAVLRELVP